MVLSSAFEACGYHVGRRPMLFFGFTGLMLLSMTGLIGLKLRDNVRDGYCPRDSRARLENQIYRDFLGIQGDPTMITVLIQARDNGSMHRLEYLDETYRQWRTISKNLTVPTQNNSTLSFNDFCGNYCQINDAIYHFASGLRIKQNTPEDFSFSMMYPISLYHGYKLHMDHYFFGVRYDTSFKEKKNSEMKTNIEHVKIISLPIVAEVKTLEDSEKLGKWELELFEYCQNYTSNPNNMLDIYVIGAEIVDTEINKDAQKMTPYFIVGFSAMLSFVIATVYLSAYYYGFAGCRMFFIGCSCSLVPTFAILTSLGINNILGFRTNSPMLIMPFLINGIGVNDAFLTLHAWMRQNPEIDRVKKLSNVLHEVGPSMTTTTVTNVVVFLIGWYSPTEEMSIFCFGCALALFFAYLYTITFFCPLLIYTLNERIHEPIKNTKIIDKFLDIYSKLICDRYVFVTILITTIIYWGFGVVGTIDIEAKLDTAKILPLDTPIRKPNRMIEEIVWKEFYPVTVIIGRPFDFFDEEFLETYERLVDRFETAPGCRGPNYTISWRRDYEKHFNDTVSINLSWVNVLFANGKTTPAPNTTDYRHVESFLKDPPFKHHRGNMVVDFSKELPIRQFSFTFVFNNTASWKERVDIMLEWRSLADQFPTLNVSVWNINAMFVDQMLSLKPLAIENVVVTLSCMAIVCLFFIQNLISVLIATLSILSISLGVTGYLSLWDLDLDPVTLCAVLVSIGMAVDFVAHTTHHYQINHYMDREGNRISLNTPVLRVKYTLINIAWPMIQAGVSTVLCIIPLVHLQNYLPLVFVKTIILVVVWGLFHGLVLLPVILAQMPLAWFESKLKNQIRCITTQ